MIVRPLVSNIVFSFVMKFSSRILTVISVRGTAQDPADFVVTGHSTQSVHGSNPSSDLKPDGTGPKCKILFCLYIYNALRFVAAQKS